MEMLEISSEKEEEEEGGTPIRSIFCLKRNTDLKSFDEKEDCFILDFNPFESLHLTHLSISNNHAEDLSVIAEKGQVACRDYPHSRHLCLKFPFETTPHATFCELCYCYVCDLAAPCNFWTEAEDEDELGHCHASENTGNWKKLRILKKKKSPKNQINV